MVVLLTLLFVSPMVLRYSNKFWSKYYGYQHESLQSWDTFTFDTNEMGKLLQCDPSIEVGEPGTVVMDPEKVTKLHMTVRGANTMTELKFHRSSDLKDNKVNIRTALFVSDNSLMEDVSVETDDSTEGLLRYTVKAPKLALPNRCVKAVIDVMIPDSLKHLDEIYVGFMSGKICLDSNMESLNLRRFKVGAGAADMDFKLLRADSVLLENAKGNINGKFQIRKMFKAMTYSGNMDLQVKAPNEGKSRITGSNVNGDIKLRMDSDFKSKFDLSTYMGEAEVKGDHVELSVDEKHHKEGRNLLKEKEKGHGRIKLATVKGKAELIFE